MNGRVVVGVVNRFARNMIQGDYLTEGNAGHIITTLIFLGQTKLGQGAAVNREAALTAEWEVG